MQHYHGDPQVECLACEARVDLLEDGYTGPDIPDPTDEEWDALERGPLWNYPAEL